MYLAEFTIITRLRRVGIVYSNDSSIVSVSGFTTYAVRSDFHRGKSHRSRDSYKSFAPDSLLGEKSTFLAR